MRNILGESPSYRRERPLYRQIQEALRDRITQGEWSTGQALPNRRALCVEFNTTRVTLDKAVQELVQEGWLRTAAGSGTFASAPGATARARSGNGRLHLARHQRRIGVLLGRIGDPSISEEELARQDHYYGPLYKGIRDGFSGKPVAVNYSHVEGGDYDEFCRQSDLDGTIIVASGLDDLPTLRRMAKAGTTFVAVSISSDITAEDRALPCIDVDNRRGAMAAVKHLLDLGHRRIAMVNLANSQSNYQDRMEGYQRAMAMAGIAVHPDNMLIYPAYHLGSFQARVDQWLTRVLSSAHRPTAIFATDYQMTLVTLRVLRQHGVRVPEDMSVVGFDDPIHMADLDPPVTTVRQPTYRLGLRASSIIIRRLEEFGPNSPLHGTEKLPTELIVRSSTCPPKQ
jgi:DNA-binding LacI/PurR family transcriptional regulator